jgi:hypothetical protein
MAKRERYKKVGVKSEIPQTYNPAMGQKAQSLGQVAQVFNQMGEFVQKRANIAAEVRGNEMVADLGAQSVLTNLSQKGGPTNIEERQAFAVASKYASQEMQTDARREISNILLNAEQNDLSNQVVDAQINDLIDGFSASFSDFDAEEAVSLRASLSSIGSIAATNYNASYQTKLNEQSQGRSIMGLNERINQMSVIASMTDANKSILAGDQIKDIEEFMRVHNFDESKISAQVIALQKQYVQDSLMSDFMQGSNDFRNEVISELTNNPLPGLTVDETRVFKNKLVAEAKVGTSKQTAEKKIIRAQLADIVKLLTGGGKYNSGQYTAIQQKIDALNDTDVDKILLQKQLTEAEYRSKNLDAYRTSSSLEIQQALSEMGDPQSGLQADIKSDMEKKLKAVNSALEKDPLLYANQVGVVKLTPIPMSGNSTATEVESAIQQRLSDVEAISTHYGLSAAPLLTADEAETINRQIGYDPTNPNNRIKRLNVFTSIVESFGNNSYKVFQQVSKDNPDYAYIGGMVSEGNFKAANLALLGSDLIEENSVAAAGYSTEDAGGVIDDLGSAYNLSPQTKMVVIETAKRIYAGFQAQSGKITWDEDNYKKALQMATGFNPDTGAGGVEEVGASEVVLPSRMTANQLIQAIETVTFDEMDRQNPGLNKELFNSLIKDLGDYNLRAISDGQYIITRGEDEDERQVFVNGKSLMFNAYEAVGLD